VTNEEWCSEVFKRGFQKEVHIHFIREEEQARIARKMAAADAAAPQCE